MILAGDVGGTRTALTVLDPAQVPSAGGHADFAARDDLQVLDTFSAASLHCPVHTETYRSGVEPTRGAEHVERSLLLGELRRGRS